MPETGEMKATWPYPLTEVSADRRVPRPGVPRGRAAELVGVDASLRGGLRPFQGFQRVYELDFYEDANHDETSVVTDFHPVTFRAGAEAFAYGFVYRVTRSSPNQSTADVFIDYYDATCNVWRAGRLLVSEVDPTKRMHVEVFGRLGYVFTQGRSPVLFYLRAKTAEELSVSGSPPGGCTEPFELVVLGTTGLAPVPGPGKQPSLKSPEDAGALGSLFTTGDSERPGAGQVVLTQTSPADSGLFPELPGTPGPGGGIGGGAFPQVKYSAAEFVAGGTNAAETINITVGANDMLLVFVFARGASAGAGSDSAGTGADPGLTVRWQDQLPGNVFDQVLTFLPGSTALFEGAGPLEQNMNIRAFYITNPTAGEGRVRVTTDETVSQLGICAQCISGHDPADPFGPLVTDVDTNTSTSLTSLATDADNQLVVFAKGWNNDDNPSSASATELWNIQNASLQFGTTWRGNGQTIPTSGGTASGNASLVSNPIRDLTDWVTVGVALNPQVVPPPPDPAGSDVTSGSGCVPGIQAEMADFVIQILHPSDDQTDVFPDVQLEWTGFFSTGAPLPSDLVWDLYFGEFGQGVPPLVATGITETVYSPGQLYAGGKLPFGVEFLWRVVARRTNCPAFAGTSSSVFSFTTKAGFDARQLEPGDYAFGYFLYDSQTGRQSALSKVAQVRREEFEIGVGGTDTAAEPHYVAMEIVWDSSKYDRAYVFRSVKVQDAGGTFIAGILQLDKIVDLEDFQTINNGPATPFPDTQDFRQSVYYYQLEDKQLAFQDVFTEQTLFDDRMPSGGAAIMFDGLMLVSSIEADTVGTPDENRPQDDLYSLGEIRWSSARVRNPELFPPFNRYVPAIPTNEVIRFIRIGGNVVGFSRDRMYHLRREGRVVRPHEMHEGFGVVNHKALDTVGSLTLFVTSKGLKSVDPFGRLDSLRVFDQLLIEDWRRDLVDHVTCGYDPLMSTYFMLNKNRDEVAVLWMNTTMATTVEDVPFAEVRQGNWPRDPLDYDDSLVERALFVQNAPKDTDDEVLAGFKPRVYVVDFDRSKTISGTLNPSDPVIGNRRTMMLDLVGDGLFQVNIHAGVFINLVDISGTLDTSYLHGAYMYMVHCPDRPDLEGTRVKLKQFSQTSGGFHQVQVVDADASKWATVIPLTNCWCSMSPIYFKWIGHNVGLQTDEGLVFGSSDFHRIKQISGLGASFTDVATQIQSSTTAPPTGIARWRGQVWEGTDAAPRDTAFPRNTDGTVVASLAEYESIHWAGFGRDTTGNLEGRYGIIGATLSPGLEIFLADCEYRLLGVRVEGKILKSTRSQRALTT